MSAPQKRLERPERPKLLVTAADLAPQAFALLHGFDVVFAGKTPQPADVLALCRLHNPQAIIVRYGGITAAMMDAAPALRVVAKHGSGTDTIDKAAAEARGIAVRAAVGANAAAVAEHAAALMLACAKHVVQLNARMHAGHWDKATHKSLELAGRTVGLVGLGAIGQRFARICQAMDMQVLAHDPFVAAAPLGIGLVDLPTLWQRSDVISLHCPLTDANRGLLNAHNLAQCKRGVLVVNTARGGLVNEAALLAALNAGQVAMAGLDSFAVEPFPSPSPSPVPAPSGLPHPFQNHANIILSPHIGGVTGDAYINMGVAAAQNLLDVLHGCSS